jgi:3-mercaptopyruvate sulfurtransferase SseA
MRDLQNSLATCPSNVCHRDLYLHALNERLLLAGIKSGHIPESKNVPFVQLMMSEPKVFKSADEIRQVFKANGVDFSKPSILSCGSGE